MPQLVFSDPIDLTAEDEVTFETEIRVGSIVTIKREGARCVSIAAVAREEAQGLPGPKYLVSKGENPGVIKFSLIGS